MKTVSTSAQSQVLTDMAASLPWWRYPLVWMIISGPLAVVVAGLVTAVIAYQHVDPVLETSRPSTSTRAAHLPALRGRNLAADNALQAQPSEAGK